MVEGACGGGEVTGVRCFVSGASGWGMGATGSEGGEAVVDDPGGLLMPLPRIIVPDEVRISLVTRCLSRQGGSHKHREAQ